jgi:hypothetical protein
MTAFPWFRGLGALAVSAALASCAGAPGSAETDRIATTVATAIGSPRPDSADGLVRAALATQAGIDSRLTVVEAEELDAKELVDPFARLVFRVHLESSGTGFSTTEQVTACYEARFSFYGVVGSPLRIDCPAGAAALVPAPLPPQAHAEIPTGFDTRLTELLAALPPAPSAPDVAAAVTSGLTPPGVDPNTGLENLPPTVEAAVDGTDVGVSLWAASGRECLLGARVGGTSASGVLAGSRCSRASSRAIRRQRSTCSTSRHRIDLSPSHNSGPGRFWGLTLTLGQGCTMCA